MRYTFLVCLVACSHTDPAPIVVAPPGSVPSSVPSAAPTLAVTKPPASCSIVVGAPTAFSIPPRLQAIAPQFFHASGREGFNDLVPGTSRYQWYDPSDLQTAVDPPPDMVRITGSTRSFYVGHAADWSLRIARRTDTKATAILGKPLHDIDLVEDGAGGVWIALGDLGSLRVPSTRIIHVDASLGTKDFAMTTSGEDPWDRRIGVTADGHVAFVWVEHVASGIELRASWLGKAGFDPPVTLDSVRLSADEADLALRTTTNLRVTADGSDRLAIGWRPLVPKPGEVAPPGPPPDRFATAEVRIFTVHPTAAATKPVVHPARAMPLGGTSGVGPWPLQGDGMAAATYGGGDDREGATAPSRKGHGVFFWIDDATSTRVVWATIADPTPHAIVAGSFRLLPRGADLVLLRSVGTQQSAPISCR